MFGSRMSRMRELDSQQTVWSKSPLRTSAVRPAHVRRTDIGRGRKVLGHENLGSLWTSEKPSAASSPTLIASGKAKPSFLVSHQLSLDEASEAYKHFDNRDEGWTNVILNPDTTKVGNREEKSDRSHGGRTYKQRRLVRAVRGKIPFAATI